ncbi:Protein of unknown function [Bacillus mobilis]
MDTAA